MRVADEVRVAVFKDRVEIRNPGELYDGLTLAAMRKGNVSKRRNPLIADLLRRIHMVETWGRGMKLILEKEPGVAFNEIAKIFIASFHRPSFKLKGKEFSPTLSEKVSEKTSEKIIRAITRNNQITIAELSSQIGITTRSVERSIKALQNDGILKRIGPDKGGHWEVVKDKK